jgi:hypothetical protein
MCDSEHGEGALLPIRALQLRWLHASALRTTLVHLRMADQMKAEHQKPAPPKRAGGSKSGRKKRK